MSRSPAERQRAYRRRQREGMGLLHLDCDMDGLTRTLIDLKLLRVEHAADRAAVTRAFRKAAEIFIATGVWPGRDA